MNNSKKPQLPFDVSSVDYSGPLLSLVLHPWVSDGWLRLIKKYFRLDVEGIENIPKKGPAIIAPNHSGYSGLDAMVLNHEIYHRTKRIPRVMTHSFWFLSPTTAKPAQKLGFVEATTENGIHLLKKNSVIILFPEGEFGNFKPSLEKYRLQEFKRGFVRMALQAQAPIVPTLVIGAEETHINLTQIKIPKLIKNLILPLPLNIIPLPAKWRLVFLPPIYLPYLPDAAENAELVHEITVDIQEKMQTALTKELQNRKNIYFTW